MFNIILIYNLILKAILSFKILHFAPLIKAQSALHICECLTHGFNQQGIENTEEKTHP